MSKEKKRFSSFVDSSSFEVLNPEFTKAKAYIMYADENRNGSSMSKESIEKALPTLYNVPLVGEFFEKENPEDSDFGTHGGRIVIDSDGVKFEQTTKPYGVLPSDADVRWEMVKEKDGTEREYLVSDVILWSGRYEELTTVFDNKNNQSMEITINDGDFNNEGVFDISDFTFSALCILGSEVEPCFESARIEVFEKQSEDAFKEMFSKYQEYLNLEKNKTDDSNVEVFEDLNKNTDSEPKEFELTYRDKYDLLAKAVRKKEENWAWVRDFTDTYVIYEVEAFTDDEYMYNNYKVEYAINEENIELSDEKLEVFQTWATKEEIDMIDSDRLQMELQFSKAKEELLNTRKELESYKQAERNKKEEDLFDMFNDILKESLEYQEIKDNKSEYSIDELEEKLHILHSKITMPKLTKKTKKNFATISKVDLDDNSNIDESNNPYKGVKFN